MARIVLITSPKRETYQELAKAGAEMLCMPLWSLDELLSCRSKMYTNVEEGLVKELYQHCGGGVRRTLQIPSEQPDKGVGELVAELQATVDSCSIAQLKAAICALDLAPEASHELLHIVASNKLRNVQLTFASQWVAEEIRKKASREDEMGLDCLVNATSGTRRGMLYEAVMHAVLAKGGSFTVAPVSLGDLERGEEQQHHLPVSKKTELFGDLKTVSGGKCLEKVYYKPSSPSFPVLDSFQCTGDIVNLFLMTVCNSKAMDAAALEDTLIKMGLQAGKTSHVFFVVPPEAYKGFKLKAAKGSWPTGPKQRLAARSKLYILKGVVARLQARAMSVQGSHPAVGVVHRRLGW
ncbi:hypothetical protein PLESTF_001070800 [Pleodorina starrii]|nr:hypothetical protein PLESTM_001146000 [Pleodorina starrii]GLC71064.1 hypothetical protein PLESTF_001070800 [Pleodorina starrii]